jgi:hypothetical protein
VTILLPSPSSQQNHKERQRSPFPCSKAIEEGGGNCRFLLLQYKVAAVFTFFSLLQKKKRKKVPVVTFFAMLQGEKKRRR